MSRKTSIGTLFGRGWLRFAGGLAAAALLLAVPTLALAFLTPGLPWLTPADPGIALPSNPVTLDAPTWDLATVQAVAPVATPPTDPVREQIIALEDWQYTAIVRLSNQPTPAGHH